MTDDNLEARAYALLDAHAGSGMDRPRYAVKAVMETLKNIDRLRIEKQEFRAEAVRWAEEAGRLNALLHDAQRDAERLDFVLGKMDWMRTKVAESGAETCWLIRLSSSSYYATPRAAIDAAMAAEREGQG
ncbi:hypothetical protein ACQHIH_16085 [Xanthomonas sontii]|uniref:hypothetical protein n=1 Tax=Xanthomonas sontii TaxID=2650745 RepID=UPI003F8468FA